MKKIILFVMLLAAMNASAQGKWTTGFNEADELKGQEGGPFFRYDLEGMGSLILWNWEDWGFKILTENGTFDVWYNEANTHHFVRFTMGLYTLDGKLKEKFDDVLEADHIEMKSAWMNKKWTHYIYDRKKIKKMFRALRSGDGYVRIVCKRRGAPDFDLKITPYNL